MKITVGHIITIVFISFGTFILYMIFQMINTKIDLVEEDYYAKEIKFQNQIEKHNNTLSLGDSILNITQNDNEISIKFNKTIPQNISVLFYYPINDKNDLKLQYNEKSEIVVNKNKLQKGRCKVKIDWDDVNKAYYFEKEILIY